jgi:sulfatase maturation enzyme AslB (radical SAM superfamily)
MTPIHILYLQLPLLDNDTQAERENFPFAAAYLDHALTQSPEAPFHATTFAPAAWDELGNPALADAILAARPTILVCTLYLWNIERTRRLATLLKDKNPRLKIAVGGPEVAHEHPLLFQGLEFDAVVTGEGEGVFPALLNHWRTNAPIDFENLALPASKGWKFGTTPAPTVDLVAAQPPEETIMRCVQHRPVVYLETVRGCPLTCSYCRYYQLHTGLRALSPDQVMARIRRFRDLGAKEIRFVDPTFNARAGFTALLEQLAKLNADQQLSFFAEIRSDTLTEKQANLMRDAHFTAVEVGVQSIDPQVLANVARPVRFDRVAAGIQYLCHAGVHIVLDIMYGLPGQTLGEVRRSLDWALTFGSSVQVQCMQTLALPGTVLRNDSKRWNFDSAPLPPYGIQKTEHLSPDDIREIEILLDEHPELPADLTTPRFCGQRLYGLFKNQHRIGLQSLNAPVPGVGNRRTLLFYGADLFGSCAAIGDLIDCAIEEEPDTLWQFVLIPEYEEPLDLLEKLAQRIRCHPAHLLDRFASAAAFDLILSRRLYIRTNLNFSNDWIGAAEELLQGFFG